MNRNIFLVALLSVAIVAVLTSVMQGCKDSNTTPASSPHVRRVAILQQGKHSIIEQVVSGCEKRLIDLYGDQVKVTKKNGGGDDSVLRQEAMNILIGNYDVIITIATAPSLAILGNSDGKTPVVFTFVTNPSTIGYSGPGSLPNVTGLINGTGFDGTLEALTQMVKPVKRIGYLVSTEPNARYILATFKEKAKQRGLELIVSNIQSGRDVPQAARSIASDVDCFLVGGDHTLVNSIDPLLDVAELFKKPVFAVDEGSVVKGAIAASTINYSKMGARTAEVVSFILAGASPNKLKPEDYENFELVINTNACSRLGLTIPESISRSARIVK